MPRLARREHLPADRTGVVRRAPTAPKRIGNVLVAKAAPAEPTPGRPGRGAWSTPRRYGHLGVRLPDGPQPIRANRRLGPPEPGGDGCPEPGAAGRPSALSPRVPQRHRERLDHGRVIAASRGNSAAEVRFLDRRLTTMTSPGSSTRRSSRSRGLATADSRLDDGKYPEPRVGVGA